MQADEGRIRKSNQIDGWADFPLRDWLQEVFGHPAKVLNDCDAAALAEASFGAGRTPLREYVDQMVFAPLRNSYHIVPAFLGEE